MVQKGDIVSLYEYQQSKKIAAEDYPFYALIMAAMRQADSINAALLRAAWPNEWMELLERYNASGGLLEGEQR